MDSRSVMRDRNSTRPTSSRRVFRASAAGGLVLLATACGCRAGWDPARMQDQPATGELSPDSSVMIVPAVMGGNPWKDVSDVLGLMLEQEGMPNVYTTEAEFKPAEGADLPKVAKAFAEWAPKQAFKQDCVLLAQVLGSPKSGVAEVRAVLTDSAGKLLWSERQTPDDKAFQKGKPSNPMTCCVFLTERLRPQFHLTAAIRGRVKDGRMQRLWVEKSGTPSEEEHAAMKQRAEKFKHAIGDAQLLVYPVQTLDGANTPYAADLVRQLGDAIDAKVTAAQEDTPLAIKVAGSSNEQKRLWDLARGFREHVRQTKPDADYTMVAEYLIRPDNKEVWSVHFVICDRAGEWVIVDFQNNHHADFTTVNPQTPEDCGKLVVRRLKGYLK